MLATEPERYSGPLPEVVPWLDSARRLVTSTVRSFLKHDGLTSSAALAFFFLMSLFPFLIFLASALALLPIPHLAEGMVHLVAHFVPEQTMPMVDSMLTSTMHTNNGLLSAGFILAVLAASNAIASMATALNTIYEAEETRSFWQKRLSAIYVTFAVGGMTAVALSAMLLGPHFGRELARVFDVSQTFVMVWPVMRWTLVLTCALAAIGTLYYLGPNCKHTLRQQVTGSLFAVAVWIASSGLLGIYLRKFSYFNAMYGTLASFIVLMTWLQFAAMAILLGAELNVELEKRRTATEQAETVGDGPDPLTSIGAQPGL